MTFKYVRKLVWYRKIYFRIVTLSKVTFLHTSHPYGGIAWHTIICQTIPQVYFCGGGGVYFGLLHRQD